MVDSALCPVIRAGAAALTLTLDDACVERLAAYVGLVTKWQHITNLTGAADGPTFVREHVVDCLALVHHIGAGRVLDVGSGAGLPGLVLAIALPATAFVLLEPRAKRARFLTQARIELGLANVDVVATRVERFRPTAPFDVIVARAFSSLAAFTACTRPLALASTRLLAMKGEVDVADLAAAEAVAGAAEVLALAVPGFSQRHLVTFRPGAPGGAGVVP